MTPSATATASTATAVVTPNPPAHLSDTAKQQWTQLYVKALAQAQRDSPNQMLAVTPPTDAAGIAALEPWQVLMRGDRVVNSVPTRVCVTTDGRKYSFPIVAPKSITLTTDLQSMTKADIVAHAAEVHGLTLDPTLTKPELIAAVVAKQ